MIRYITIAGTWGMHHTEDWYSPTSNLSKFLLDHQAIQLETNPLKRYMWSTGIDGIDKHNDTWDAAGRALADYVSPPLLGKALIAPEDTYLIAHSHGGNVVAYACAVYGLKINGLITVGTPIRKDLNDVYKAAAPNISRHLHLYAGWRDYMQTLGALFDGRFGIHRKHPFAGRNGRVPGGNHGSILRDTSFFHLWMERGWLDYWMGTDATTDTTAR
jgi:pimeloyl-ACP methyl ester carboxylesterase